MRPPLSSPREMRPPEPAGDAYAKRYTIGRADAAADPNAGAEPRLPIYESYAGVITPSGLCKTEPNHVYQSMALTGTVARLRDVARSMSPRHRQELVAYTGAQDEKQKAQKLAANLAVNDNRIGVVANIYSLHPRTRFVLTEACAYTPAPPIQPRRHLTGDEATNRPAHPSSDAASSRPATAGLTAGRHATKGSNRGDGRPATARPSSAAGSMVTSSTSAQRPATAQAPMQSQRLSHSRGNGRASSPPRSSSPPRFALHPSPPPVPRQPAASRRNTKASIGELASDSSPGPASAPMAAAARLGEGEGEGEGEEVEVAVAVGTSEAREQGSRHFHETAGHPAAGGDGSAIVSAAATASGAAKEARRRRQLAAKARRILREVIRLAVDEATCSAKNKRELSRVAKVAVEIRRAADALRQSELLDGLGDTQLSMLASSGRRASMPSPPLPSLPPLSSPCLAPMPYALVRTRPIRHLALFTPRPYYPSHLTLFTHPGGGSTTGTMSFTARERPPAASTCSRAA